MPFEKFTEIRRSHMAKVSISPTGMISFSDGAKRRFGLKDYDFCILYYDKDSKKIGIELTKEEHADGAINLRKRTTGAYIAAKSFVDFFNLGFTNTMIFHLERDEKSGYLIIDLNKGKKRMKKKDAGMNE